MFPNDFHAIYNSFPIMSCKGIFWKQNSKCSNFDFVVTTQHIYTNAFVYTDLDAQKL